jgi:general stress protein CsbA
MNYLFWVGVAPIFSGVLGLALSGGDIDAIGVSAALIIIGCPFLFVGLFTTISYGVETLIGICQLAIVVIGGSASLNLNKNDPFVAVANLVGLLAVSLVVGYVKKIFFRRN